VHTPVVGGHAVFTHNARGTHVKRNQTKRNDKLRTLELKKETIGTLMDHQLTDVAGGNTSSTVKSQCPTLCFT